MTPCARLDTRVGQIEVSLFERRGGAAQLRVLRFDATLLLACPLDFCARRCDLALCLLVRGACHFEAP